MREFELEEKKGKKKNREEREGNGESIKRVQKIYFKVKKRVKRNKKNFFL